MYIIVTQQKRIILLKSNSHKEDGIVPFASQCINFDLR